MSLDLIEAFDRIDWLSVIVATVVAIAIGSVWYHEKVMGADWMKAVGLKKKDLEKADMKQSMGGMTIGTLLQAAGLGILIEATGATDIGDTVALAGFIAIFFVLTTMSTNILFEQRDHKVFFINAGHVLFTFIAMGLVYGLYA